MKSRAFVYSVLLHIVVFSVLIISIEPSKKLAPMGPPKPIIEAKAVNLAAIEAEKKRKADLLREQKERELEKQRAAEQKREEAAEKKRRDEQRKQEEAKKRAEEKKKAEEKALKEAAAKRKAEAEKAAAEKKRQEAERLKAEQERKAREAKKREQERKKAEEKARQKALEDALAAEERELAEARQQAADENEISKYMRAIAGQVTSAFRYPPGLDEGMTCTLYVRMIPGGEVIEARVTKSSGNAIFDRQAENAVRKAAPLPVPDEARLFSRMREIQFVFDPSG